MKSLPWVIAGVAVGAAVYFIVNQPAPSYASGDVESAADKTDLWGGKQRLKGTGGSLVGKAKEAFGNATGNDDLAAEGTGDQMVGDVKDAVGKVANAASDTLREFNRT